MVNDHDHHPNIWLDDNQRKWFSSNGKGTAPQRHCFLNADKKKHPFIWKVVDKTECGKPTKRTVHKWVSTASMQEGYELLNEAHNIGLYEIIRPQRPIPTPTMR